MNEMKRKKNTRFCRELNQVYDSQLFLHMLQNFTNPDPPIAVSSLYSTWLCESK
ncbi:hypothetical protein WN48_10979 [Eufriesea mexicana]|uniref:Uncharacterized protein n=1 Tax=Eufriesea mexicana TaxID=516756 RepID=A0A310SDK3_9HYME|nr:hypothetical protein WN48_10979 [Eufriesea mexicana]